MRQLESVSGKRLADAEVENAESSMENKPWGRALRALPAQRLDRECNRLTEASPGAC
jgi:hypothetical protein